MIPIHVATLYVKRKTFQSGKTKGDLNQEFTTGGSKEGLWLFYIPRFLQKQFFSCHISYACPVYFA
eukprot:3895294-Amphidinium_carterae.1